MGHRQVFVKVNAPVDVGISGIVESLSGFSELETIESCEGSAAEWAWISFRYGRYWEHPWRDLSDFVLQFLAPRLFSIVGDDATVSIQIKPSGLIFGELNIRPGTAPRIEAALRQLSRQLAPSNAIARSVAMAGLAHSNNVA